MAIPLEPRYVEQIHGWMYRYTGDRHAGRFKQADNAVVERGPDGTIIQRFAPVDAQRTPAAMDELHRAFAVATATEHVPYPLVCAAYLLDFLAIHPFTDGNGRMSRLLTILLLYGGGYDVVRYVSLDRLIAESRVAYYETLAASTAGWSEGRHDLLPWTRYFLGLLAAAYRELGKRRNGPEPPVAGKREAIYRFVSEYPRAEFTAAEVNEAVPEVSRDYLGVILRGLRDDGAVERIGVGRGARWRRIGGPH